MQETVFGGLIAKLIVLADQVLGIFVDVTWVPNTANNCVGGAYDYSITDCGTVLIGQLGTLMVQGVGALSGMMAGLSVNV
jgi:hypothetical protein